MSNELRQFYARVADLVASIKRWAEPHDWVTKEYPKRIRDVDSQVFEFPALFLQRGPIRLLLDPIAHDVPGAEGVVDLYLMPTYDDMASLYFEEGGWVIHYSFPPDAQATDAGISAECLPLRDDTINKVLDAIATHAAPSF